MDKQSKELLSLLGKYHSGEFELTLHSENTNYIFFSAVGNSLTCPDDFVVQHFNGCFFYNNYPSSIIEEDGLRKRITFSMIKDNDVAQILNHDSTYFHIAGRPIRNLGVKGRSGWGYSIGDQPFSDLVPIPIIKGQIGGDGCTIEKDLTSGKKFVIGLVTYDCKKHDVMSYIYSKDFLQQLRLDKKTEPQLYQRPRNINAFLLDSYLLSNRFSDNDEQFMLDEKMEQLIL